LAGYLWKNRDLQRSTEQLIYIAGIVLFQLGLGISEDTSIDNTGHIGALQCRAASHPTRARTLPFPAAR
jgi:hypothetical protein